MLVIQEMALPTTSVTFDLLTFNKNSLGINRLRECE